MMDRRPYEECFICGELTGRAGKSDDSIYCEKCDLGPFCVDCFDEHEKGIADVKCISKTVLVYQGEEYELK